MFHTPVHKQAQFGAQVFPAGSIVGPSEFDTSDAPKAPRTLAEVAAIAEEIDGGIRLGEEIFTDTCHAYDRLLKVIRSAVEAPVPSVAAALATAQAPATPTPIRFCVDCLHYEKASNVYPCSTCLPQAGLLPNWSPRQRKAEVDLPWAAVTVEN